MQVGNWGITSDGQYNWILSKIKVRESGKRKGEKKTRFARHALIRHSVLRASRSSAEAECGTERTIAVDCFTLGSQVRKIRGRAAIAPV